MANKIPVINIRNKKLSVFLVVQYLIFLFIYQIAPKNIMQLVYVSEILLFSYIFITKIPTLKHIIKKGDIVANLPRLLLYFTIISAVYLILSYNDLSGMWDLEDLPFDKSYVPRHFMIVIELFLPIGLGYMMYKTDILYRIKNIYLIFFLIITYALRYLNINPLPYTGLFVAALTLLAFQTKKPWLIVLTFLALPSHSAYLMGTMFICVLTYFRNRIVSWFKVETTFRMYLLIMLIVFAFAIFASELYSIISRDENSLWRLMVWQNEINSLGNTYYTGVGFGTAYVTPHIYYEVNNPNMYLDAEDGSVYDRLFIVANHNSFLNMFYRMGLLGGFLFIAIYIQIIRWALCLYSKAREYIKPYIWCAFCGFMYQTIVILLNPGLEMMQFAMNFCLAVAILIAVLLRAQIEVIMDRQ